MGVFDPASGVLKAEIENRINVAASGLTRVDGSGRRIFYVISEAGNGLNVENLYLTSS